MPPRIHHLNCGTMCPMCRRLMNGTGGWFESGRMVCHCLLVESGDQRVLVDTGFGSADLEAPRERLGGAFLAASRPTLDADETAVARLAALGVAADAVTHIVPTHLDLDHIGGLSDFAEAQVHVYAPEHDQLTDRPRFAPPRIRMAQVAHGPRWVRHAQATETWFGFEAIRPLPGLDLLMVPLVGHSPGHVGVAVHDGRRWLLHCGDAYFHRGTLDSPRGAPLGVRMFESLVAWSNPTRRATQDRLRALHRDHGDEVTLFCAHDPVELERMQRGA